MCGNIAVTAGPFLDLCYTWHRFRNTFQYEIHIVYNSVAAVVNCTGLYTSVTYSGSVQEHSMHGSPNCWRRYRLVLKMRATPASVSTHVSAHCFSAVSREWWIRMFPPPDSIFSLSAVVEDFLTQSSRWNRT